MDRGVTFVHAADIHLGASFAGLTSASDDITSQLVEAISGSFNNIINLCLKRKVDFLVLAGDTFNKGTVPFRVEQVFLNGMQRLEAAGIEVFLLLGNHDPFTTWSKRLPCLPRNVHVFAADEPSYFVFERDGSPLAVIAGRSFAEPAESRNLALGLTRDHAQKIAGDARFYIGVLHTGLGKDEFAPCSEDDLAAAGFDYWALGHEHLHRELEGVSAAYAGTPQALDTTDSSDHGCYLVALNPGRSPHTTFFKTATVAWSHAAIDVSDVSRTTDLLKILIRKGDELMFEHKTSVCAHITFKGRTPLHGFFADERNLDSLREEVLRRGGMSAPWLYIDELTNRTLPVLDEPTIAQEGLFASALLAARDEILADATLLRNEIDARIGKQELQALSDEHDLGRCIEAAAAACLDLLKGDSSI